MQKCNIIQHLPNNKNKWIINYGCRGGRGVGVAGGVGIRGGLKIVESCDVGGLSTGTNEMSF